VICILIQIHIYILISGSTCGKISVDKCLDNIAESINQAHSKTNNVITGKIYKAKMVSGNTLNPRKNF
jgi:endonuclease IV